MKPSLTLLFAFLSIIGFGQTGEKNFIDQNYIEITGTAEMSVVPDLIYIKIIISEKDTKNKVSVADMEKNMISKFQEIGIDVKRDLSIDDLLSTYKNKILAKSDVIISKQYQLVVHDAKIAEKIFSELEKIGISNMSIQRVDRTKIAEFSREVKLNAIKAAKEKADLLVKAINQNIGRAIYIKELNEGENVYYLKNVVRTPRYQVSNSDSEETNLEFEKIRLEGLIMVRFELK